MHAFNRPTRKSWHGSSGTKIAKTAQIAPDCGTPCPKRQHRLGVFDPFLLSSSRLHQHGNQLWLGAWAPDRRIICLSCQQTRDCPSWSHCAESLHGNSSRMPCFLARQYHQPGCGEHLLCVSDVVQSRPKRISARRDSTGPKKRRESSGPVSQYRPSPTCAPPSGLHPLAALDPHAQQPRPAFEHHQAVMPPRQAWLASVCTEYLPSMLPRMPLRLSPRLSKVNRRAADEIGG